MSCLREARHEKALYEGVYAPAKDGGSPREADRSVLRQRTGKAHRSVLRQRTGENTPQIRPDSADLTGHGDMISPWDDEEGL